MKLVRTDAVLARLEQLVAELSVAEWLHYHDRLREFRDYCLEIPALAGVLATLPRVAYDFSVGLQALQQRWPQGDAGYAIRWDAINQIVDSGSDRLVQSQLRSPNRRQGLATSTNMFVLPLYNYLVHRLQMSSTMLWLLLRYKRWAEWFEANQLRAIYEDDGEQALDRSLRRFLFESGIDYPFSEPWSPGGRADIVAQLDTDDPLVLEAKVWDSKKGYREDRLRDGFRQVIDYADKYGKDKGYVVVFNLDFQPLAFTGEPATQDWPSRLEHGGKTYYFVTIEIAEQLEPVSQRAKGKPVDVNEVALAKLWADGTAQEA